MLRRATVVLVVVAALAPVAAAGGGLNHTRHVPAQRVVVRTELVPAQDGFDWGDAAAGFGVAIACVSVVLLVAAHRFPRN